LPAEYWAQLKNNLVEVSQGTQGESLELRPGHQLMGLVLWESERKLVLQV